MPFEAAWYLETRVIYVRACGFVDLAEVRESNTVITRYLEGGTAPVHILLDLTQLDGFEAKLPKLSEVAAYLRHKAFGWLVTYGAAQNPLLPFFADALARLTGARIRTFRTQEEALAFLSMQDATLSALSKP